MTDGKFYGHVIASMLSVLFGVWMVTSYGWTPWLVTMAAGILQLAIKGMAGIK